MIRGHDLDDAPRQRVDQGIPVMRRADRRKHLHPRAEPVEILLGQQQVLGTGFEAHAGPVPDRRLRRHEPERARRCAMWSLRSEGIRDRRGRRDRDGLRLGRA